MDTDITTLNDLSIFQHEEENSIFHKLNFTRTTGGREKLRSIFSRSLPSLEAIRDTQQTLKAVAAKSGSWPKKISNGSILMIHKYYESTVDQIPPKPSAISAYLYKIFHAPDYSLVKYSSGHAYDFIKGMQHMVETFSGTDTPSNLKLLLEKATVLMEKYQLRIVESTEKFDDMGLADMLTLAHFFRYHYKDQLMDLIEVYYQLDAWYSMATAATELGLVYPEMVTTERPSLSATGLFHILLQDPVAYDIGLDHEHNFIFLTGANMAGKSTFIKAVGCAVFLAHIGMAVPAKSMTLSLFDGLLSNINVVDNLLKGESYFYNEVQRIKNTILKINDGRTWLILIDELFKGTNVQDAMKCSAVVIEGLLKMKNCLFILSTHLYEIGETLKQFSNIEFKYFETTVENEQLTFSYRLKEGISNDRLGYLILKREHVLEMLDGLG
ncbi:MAG: DNA mismatch repair protein MutS [Bacteroidota bacterium]|nr:DNA mismatch repair protein MutS [Bacteroidota bacterium]